MARCTMCQNPVLDTRHIALYVIGSEGLDLCHACEMELVGFVRGKMREYSEVKRAAYVQTQRNEIIKEDRTDG